MKKKWYKRLLWVFLIGFSIALIYDLAYPRTDSFLNELFNTDRNALAIMDFIVVVFYSVLIIKLKWYK